MNKKAIVIIITFVVLAAITALVLFLTVFKDKSYRILKVFEVDGDATVTRKDIGDIDPYVNMVLESGDNISLKTGLMTLQADEDKFIYLEEGTELVLNASGNSQNSRTTIELKSGAITNDIQNKLSEDSSYEINTPNSTMSVRGTMFRVCVYEENGIKYTKITVFDGSVASYLVYKDGSKSETEVLVERGKEVLIYEDDKTTDYVYPPRDIAYDELPDNVLEILKAIVEGGRDLDISLEELEEYLNGMVTVTFMYNGSVFGTQNVKKGDKASVPALIPEAGGSWNWNFSDPLEKDTVIEWK